MEWYISSPKDQLAAVEGSKGLTIKISQESLRTSLLPIIGRYKHPSTTIGGITKYKCLSYHQKERYGSKG